MTLHQRPSLFSVELRTARWAELVEWYRNVLGLRVLVRVVDDGYALFAAGLFQARRGGGYRGDRGGDRFRGL